MNENMLFKGGGVGGDYEDDEADVDQRGARGFVTVGKKGGKKTKKTIQKKKAVKKTAADRRRNRRR